MQLRFLTHFFVALGCIAMSGIAVTGAHADDSKLRAAIQAKFPNANVQSITEVSGIGLYELVIDGSIYYSDAGFDYLIDGNIIEVKSMRNVTAQRKQEIEEAELKKLAMPFDDLPLASAFKKVYGDGSRRMAYFADPNCGYCKRLAKDLANIKDTTIYTFLYPILSEDSAAKSRAIWCAKDRAAAWNSWMIDGKTPLAPAKDCKAPMRELVELGQSFGVTGTPTLIFADGTRAPGAIPLAQIEATLAGQQVR